MSLNAIRYCVAARIADKVVVSSYFHGPDSGRLRDYEASVKKVLQAARIDERPKLSITDRELGTIHYDSDLECIYIVVTAADYPQRTAFQLLGEFKEGFKTQFAGQIGAAAENGLNKVSTKKFFPELCTRYSDLKNVDKIHSVMAQVDSTKVVMQQNIEKIIENGDNLSQLQDKTETMRVEAQRFQKQSNQLHKVMWWKNMKMKIIIALIVLVVITVIALIIYGATKKK